MSSTFSQPLQNINGTELQGGASSFGGVNGLETVFKSVDIGPFDFHPTSRRVNKRPPYITQIIQNQLINLITP